VLPGTQLNKQQFTTAKVSVGQSWKANGEMPQLGRVDVGAKWLVTIVTCDVCCHTCYSLDTIV